LQAKSNAQALVHLEVKEDAEIETLPFVSDTPEGISLLKILKRGQNMSEVRDQTRRYLFGDQEVFSERVKVYRMRAVSTLVNAVRQSKMWHIRR
jgi:hypothetical protein